MICDSSKDEIQGGNANSNYENCVISWLWRSSLILDSSGVLVRYDGSNRAAPEGIDEASRSGIEDVDTTASGITFNCVISLEGDIIRVIHFMYAAAEEYFAVFGQMLLILFVEMRLNGHYLVLVVDREGQCPCVVCAGNVDVAEAKGYALHD